MHDVRDSFQTGHVERWTDTMQLRAARYRLVDLLRISVFSVTVTERCYFVQLTLRRVCLGCSLLSLHPNEMADPKEHRMLSSFVVTVSNQLLRPTKFLKKPFVIMKWVEHIPLNSTRVSELTKLRLRVWTFWSTILSRADENVEEPREVIHTGKKRTINDVCNILCV